MLAREQRDLVTQCANAHGIIVNAVAGSGKTTTVLQCAAAYPQWSFWMLTYNAHLRRETQVRARAASLENLTVHTFHSFVVHTFAATSFTDTIIEEALRVHNAEARIPPIHVLVVDEAQDLTHMYCNLVALIVRARNPKVILVGDAFQAIWQCRGASPSFFLNPGTWLSTPRPRTWETQPLHTSFRVHAANARFVNRCLLGREYVRAHRKVGIKPLYVTVNLWNASMLCDLIESVVGERYGYQAEDVFIMSRSVRQPREQTFATPMIAFENECVRRRIPVHVSTGIAADPRLFHKKMVLSTYHGTKGLERPVAILLGVDMGDCHVLDESDRSRCANEIYTAATRATELLVLVQHYEYAPLTTFPSQWQSMVQLIPLQSTIAALAKPPRERTQWCLSQLMAHQPVSRLQQWVSEHARMQCLRSDTTCPFTIPHVWPPDDDAESIECISELVEGAMMLGLPHASGPASFVEWLSQSRKWLFAEEGVPRYRHINVQLSTDPESLETLWSHTRSLAQSLALPPTLECDRVARRGGIVAHAHWYDRRVGTIWILSSLTTAPPFETQLYAIVAEYVFRATDVFIYNMYTGGIWQLHGSNLESLILKMKTASR